MPGNSISAVRMPDGKWHAIGQVNGKWQITDHIITPTGPNGQGSVSIFNPVTGQQTSKPVQIDQYFHLDNKENLVPYNTEDSIPWSNNVPGNKTPPNTHAPTNYTPPDQYHFDSKGIMRDAQGNRVYANQGGHQVGQNVWQGDDGSVWVTNDNGSSVLHFKSAADATAYFKNGGSQQYSTSDVSNLPSNTNSTTNSTSWLDDPRVSISTNSSGGKLYNVRGSDGVTHTYTDPAKAQSYYNSQVAAQVQAANMGVLNKDVALLGLGNKMDYNGKYNIVHNPDSTYDVFDLKGKKLNSDLLLQPDDVTRLISDKEGSAPSGSGSGDSSRSSNNSEGGGSIMDKLMNSRGVQLGTAVLTGYGLYAGFKSMFQEFNAGALMGTGMSSLFFVQSTTRLIERFGMSSGQAIAVALAVMAVIAIIAYLTRLKEDLQQDVTKGDVSDITGITKPAGTTTSTTASTAPKYPTWYQMLPSQSVFTILAGVSALTIGINLAVGGPLSQSVSFKTTQLPDVTSQLAKATGKTMPESLIGKVFIKKGDGTTIPDKAVYVTQEGEDNYKVNMVSLNSGGYLLSDKNPMSMTPFFLVEPRSGAVIANPAAQNDLGAQTALSRAGSSDSVSPRSRTAAVRLGGAQGHRYQEVQR